MQEWARSFVHSFNIVNHRLRKLKGSVLIPKAVSILARPTRGGGCICTVAKHERFSEQDC